MRRLYQDKVKWGGCHPPEHPKKTGQRCAPSAFVNDVFFVFSSNLVAFEVLGSGEVERRNQWFFSPVLIGRYLSC
ncbi:hypothetical protein CEXT_88471 [Caerostris extrusa]|uniref:Uncharacterized protein n=1 Tax=Caerostris extrusa TaxID=172846 RepID=A0AAV4RNH2_CAEEX|nr:hypothetical protein CEXT_88471 [Caerostris extrusa]